MAISDLCAAGEMVHARVLFKYLVSVPHFLGAHLETVKVCSAGKWNAYVYHEKQLFFKYVKHCNIPGHWKIRPKHLKLGLS